MNWLRSLWRFFKYTAYALFGYGVCLPLGLLIPRRRDLAVFLEASDGVFSDNVKYLYLYVNRRGRQGPVQCVYLTRSRALRDLLKSQGLPAEWFPSMRSLWLLLRARLMIADSTRWAFVFRRFLLARAVKIQLWHGVPLKAIERDVFSGPLSLRRRRAPRGWMQALAFRWRDFWQDLLWGVVGMYPTYDFLLSHSAAWTRVSYRSAFRARFLFEDGFPRIEGIFWDDESGKWIGADLDCLERVRQHRAGGGKVILYAPTFRDTGGNAIADGALEIARLDAFAQRHQALILFKFHVSGDAMDQVRQARSILCHSSRSDVYPLFPLIDLMITDYSSIYFDYLFLDRPVVFFCYDLEKYQSRDRPLYFSYEEMTPGPKCRTQEALEEALAGLLSGGKDEFRAQRQRILEMAFDQRDLHFCERIWGEILRRHAPDLNT